MRVLSGLACASARAPRVLYIYPYKLDEFVGHGQNALRPLSRVEVGQFTADGRDDGGGRALGAPHTERRATIAKDVEGGGDGGDKGVCESGR